MNLISLNFSFPEPKPVEIFPWNFPCILKKFVHSSEGWFQWGRPKFLPVYLVHFFQRFNQQQNIYFRTIYWHSEETSPINRNIYWVLFTILWVQMGRRCVHYISLYFPLREIRNRKKGHIIRAWVRKHCWLQSQSRNCFYSMEYRLRKVYRTN